MINPAEKLQEQMGMSLADFLEEAHNQPFDLINGKRMRLTPETETAGHGEVVRTLFLTLDQYASKQTGQVFTKATCIFTAWNDRNRVTGSRTPDIMFYVGQRLAEYKAANPDWRERPFALVPDMVEVISPTDKYTEVNEKIDAYLQDGVRLVVVIDPVQQKITVHGADLETPLVLRGDTRLEGGDVLPDFQLELKDLFV